MTQSYDIQGVFARKLGEERRKQNLTQEELADMAGISTSTVTRYEREKTAAKLETAALLADALEISLASLLPEWIDEPNAKQA